MKGGTLIAADIRRHRRAGEYQRISESIWQNRSSRNTTSSRTVSSIRVLRTIFGINGMKRLFIGGYTENYSQYSNLAMVLYPYSGCSHLSTRFRRGDAL